MVTRRKINGIATWIIDRRFRGAAGEERYRRAAQVQLKAAAEAEERRIIDYWTANGTIKPLLMVVAPVNVPEPEPVKVHTWDDALKMYTEIELPKKKPSTRSGYQRLADGPGFKFWAGLPLISITGPEIEKWDTSLVLTGVTESTRRNHQILLRTVLKAAKRHCLVDTVPEFPSLPRVGEKPIQTFSVADFDLIMNEGKSTKVKYCQIKAIKAGQLAFALAAYAGLRAGEVRALRRKDVDLTRRVITVRVARSVGEESTPKSGHSRPIPIGQRLYDLLKPRCEGLAADDYVCVMGNGKPWGEFALIQSVHRACKRLKIEGARYHALRHFFGTLLVGKGVDIKTLQGLLGHANISVTQRYAHYEDKRAREAVAMFGSP